MGLFRLYTGSDSLSHCEERTLTSHPALQEPHPQYTFSIVNFQRERLWTGIPPHVGSTLFCSPVNLRSGLRMVRQNA
jgi:hypothetical protein